MKSSNRIFLAAALILILIGVGFLFVNRQNQSTPAGFNGERALADASAQVSLGPRIPGTPSHQAAIDYFVLELTQADWEVDLQEVEIKGHLVRNVIAKRGSGNSGWLIFGAHYDSRMVADQDSDPANQASPVAGANDGASGAAVLLELARSLPKELDREIWLAFFDAEDQGNLPGWDWILGSSALAASFSDTNLPDGVIIVDMIGDADLNIYMERNSDGEITREIWETAAELGYANSFIPEYKFSMIDDHTPFLQRGIPAADLIDFDYPYWHTTEDTIDKISAASLDIVGDTLYQWVTTR